MKKFIQKDSEIVKPANPAATLSELAGAPSHVANCWPLANRVLDLAEKDTH